MHIMNLVLIFESSQIKPNHLIRMEIPAGVVDSFRGSSFTEVELEIFAGSRLAGAVARPWYELSAALVGAGVRSAQIRARIDKFTARLLQHAPITRVRWIIEDPGGQIGAELVDIR